MAIAVNEPIDSGEFDGPDKQDGEVYCIFFSKIGACKHGYKCSRTHIIPNFSQKVLFKSLCHNPVISKRQADTCTKVGMMNKDEQQYFDEFLKKRSRKSTTNMEK
ncbi:hypothetical protein TELCIR_09911 [Teladorsagia circumcincta]|uniref:C3H1-type domain-containing protein n=1 Tax=Teladorsagia circumcincta TaxID=45464 RepID=A0A2G9UEZ2_TELCI|nr:hypothetical protein TELCIR_09911 [Teladorsagia circumcincta]